MLDATDTLGPDPMAEFRALVKRADAGDDAALPIVMRVFDEVPSLWDAYGDLATTAENALVDLVAGKSKLTQAATRRHLATMRANLGGPNPSPLDRLLIQRVVACWLQSQQADLAYARSLRGSSPAEVEHHHRRQDRAARQNLKALRTLATVSRLLVPPMQVNIAERQVNIAANAFRPEEATSPVQGSS